MVGEKKIMHKETASRIVTALLPQPDSTLPIHYADALNRQQEFSFRCNNS